MSVRAELAMRWRTPVRLNLGQLECLLAATESADTRGRFRGVDNPDLHNARVIIERARNRRLRAVKRAEGGAA